MPETKRNFPFFKEKPNLQGLEGNDKVLAHLRHVLNYTAPAAHAVIKKAPLDQADYYKRRQKEDEAFLTSIQLKISSLFGDLYKLKKDESKDRTDFLLDAEARGKTLEQDLANSLLYVLGFNRQSGYDNGEKMPWDLLYNKLVLHQSKEVKTLVSLQMTIELKLVSKGLMKYFEVINTEKLDLHMTRNKLIDDGYDPEDLIKDPFGFQPMAKGNLPKINEDESEEKPDTEEPSGP